MNVGMCQDCGKGIESEPYLIAQYEDRYEVYHMDCKPTADQRGAQ